MKFLIFSALLVGVLAIFITFGDKDKHVRPILVYLPDPISSYVYKYLGLSSNQQAKQPTSDVLLTKEELWKFRGENDSPIYLAVLGNIYDVTKGRKHYKIGGSYDCFSGRHTFPLYIN